MVNIVMNSIILWLTAWGAGVSYKSWRILLAAILGGVYVVSGIWPEFVVVHYAPVKLLVSCLIVFTAFGFKSIRTHLLLVGIFYIISFILGGAIVGWLYFWQNSSYIQMSELRMNMISLGSLAAGSLVGIVLILIVMRRIISRMLRANNFYPIKIDYADRQVELVSILDTGNSLYTVMGRKPVIVVERSKIETILSDLTVSFLKENEAELWLTHLDQCLDHDWLSRIQVIPYQAIGSTNMLIGFRPDKLTVITKSGEITTTEVVVAIYNGHLSSDGAYTALLNPLIINNAIRNEEVGVCA
jgi:stage II sporulation protein GA (sporulation sigma-E factor processing peptidase)